MPTPRLLMCPPDFFGVHYVINPWMEGHIDLTLSPVAISQWNSLHAIVQQHAEVSLLPPREGLPDLVFTANAAVVHQNNAVISSFLYPQRQGEEIHFRNWFEQQSFFTHTLPREVSFEGAGDALFDEKDDLLWFGHGVRSSLAAMPYLQRLLKTEVQPLQLLQSRFYHLDTCFCPLKDGFLLYYPYAFDAASNQVIESLVPAEHRLAVSEQDALNFACNAINLGRSVILHQASQSLQDWLAERRFKVIETATTEFLKAGGSAKCLSLRLD